MTKFGELINAETPVLIDFYSDWNAIENNLDTLRSVAAALGEKAKVIKIDIKILKSSFFTFDDALCKSPA